MQSKRKQRSENFDVTEFLRPTDTDLKSALTSLLTHQVADDRRSAEAVTVQPDTLPNTATPSSATETDTRTGSNTAPGSLHDPDHNFRSDSEYSPDANKDSAPVKEQQEPGRPNERSVMDNSAPGSVYDPGYNFRPDSGYSPDANKD